MTPSARAGARVAACAALAGVFCLGGAPEASEAAKGPIDYGAYLPIAQAYWGGAVPEGGIPPIVHGVSDPQAAIAEYWPRTHEIHVNDDYMNAMPPANRCAIMVHEYGHALGHGHTEEHVVSVMNPGVLAIPEQCKALSERYANLKRKSSRAARRARARRAQEMRLKGAVPVDYGSCWPHDDGHTVVSTGQTGCLGDDGENPNVAMGVEHDPDITGCTTWKRPGRRPWTSGRCRGGKQMQQHGWARAKAAPQRKGKG